MAVKRITRIDVAGESFYLPIETLEDGFVFRRNGLGLIPVDNGWVKSVTVKNDALEADLIPRDKLDEYIFSGGKAEIETTPIRIEAAEINSGGSQLYNNRRIGPFEIWTSLCHSAEKK